MNGRKYLLALWLSITLYAVSSFTVGPVGIASYEKTRGSLERLRTNMEELKAINHNLEGIMDALRYDSDTIMVYARELGYGAQDERFIRIVGLPGASKRRVAAGQLILYKKPETVSDRFLRVLSLSLGLTLFIVFSVFDYIGKKKRNPSDNFSKDQVFTAL
ncbi:MAG: septum formation initiator family protein [Spirochaetaceae bacterium]|jgi:cell division protein FtsB|nr:septum formation initiator family protein [Spirochaetaceae bacterium]